MLIYAICAHIRILIMSLHSCWFVTWVPDHNYIPAMLECPSPVHGKPQEHVLNPWDTHRCLLWFLEVPDIWIILSKTWAMLQTHWRNYHQVGRLNHIEYFKIPQNVLRHAHDCNKIVLRATWALWHAHHTQWHCCIYVDLRTMCTCTHMRNVVLFVLICNMSTRT